MSDLEKEVARTAFFELTNGSTLMYDWQLPQHLKSQIADYLKIL